MQGKDVVRSMERSRPPAGETRSDVRPLKLLVSIPALDEQQTIADVVRGVPREIPGIGTVEVVVVDDGSRDETASRAAEVGAHVIRHPRSRGVGAAFHTAVAYAIENGVDLLVSIDADGQFDPADIPALVAPVVADEADFTTASRFKDPSLVPDMPAIKLWGNRMMSRLISSLAGQTFHDVSCGMRCYDRRALLQLHLLARFTYTQEVILNLAFKNLRIVEVPIRVRGVREFGDSRVANSLWRYGLRTAQIIFRCYRDYHPLRFFGGAALLLLVPALGLSLFLLLHYLATGGFTPHKWAGFSAIALVALALLIVQIGVIGDMLNRHRVYLEEILFRQRNESRGDGGER
jgi:glycosyltransferase involved in cell wall biosynthesis